MFIPEKMKVNKFEDVAIPSNKSFFARLGQVSPDVLKYSGDEVVPEQMTKSQEIDDFALYAEQMAREQATKDSEK